MVAIVHVGFLGVAKIKFTKKMDLQKTIALFRQQCQAYEMMLRNMQQMVGMVPPEMIEKQLKELESMMMPRNDGVCCYFPRKSSGAEGYIYVLKLEGDSASDFYYYVGFTQDVGRRMQEHFSGNGSEWTKAHKALSILEVVEGEKADERQKTIEVMKKYGWSTTRGYCWTSKIMRSPPRDLDFT